MRTGPFALCCLLLLAGSVATPLTASAGTGPDHAESGAPDPTGALSGHAERESLAQPNDTSVRHRNPENRSEPGDLDRVQGYLSGRMGELVVDCSEGIRIGEYDPCERADEEYPDFLEKYVDLTERTDGEEDDRTAETLAETRDDQKEFENETRAFRETLEEYREAREAGNTTRARRLARELIRTGNAANRTGRELTENLRRIENRTGVETDEGRNAARAVLQNITNVTQQVETDLFTPADLTAEPVRRSASLTRPLVVTGRLTAEGDPLGNRTVTLRPVGDSGRRVTARTNASGHYRLTYRPVTVRTGERTFRVRYRPAPAAPYLGANATARVRVRPPGLVDVNRTLVVDAQERVDYGDRVSARARLSVDGVGLASVPLRGTLAGVPLGTARTGADGRVGISDRLPARVRPGDRPLRVVFPLDGRALGAVNATTRVTVVTSGTALRLSGSQPTPVERRLRVAGQLVTDDGDPVRNQPVRIAVAGGGVRSVRTNATGGFATRLSLPNETDPTSDGTVVVNASFDGSGTNLRDAAARTSVSLRGADGEGSAGANGDSSATDGGGISFGDAALAALAVAGLLVLAGSVYLLRRHRDGTTEPEPSEPGTAPDAPDASPSDGEVEAGRPGPAARLEAGDARGAVLSSYALARSRLADNTSGAQTHWEFYRSRADQVDQERSRALRRLTELYETTVFGPDGPSPSAAEEAVNAVGVITAND